MNLKAYLSAILVDMRFFLFSAEFKWMDLNELVCVHLEFSEFWISYQKIAEHGDIAFARPFKQKEFHQGLSKVAFVKEVGIKRELTTPYNPQHNGVAERKNKTIMEAVKAMFHDQDLPMHLWAEAARTSIYVQNIISHRALGNKTPEEMFTGEKPEVNHLKIRLISI